MAVDNEELKSALAFAIEKYPHQVELAAVEDLPLDSARQTDKRPAYLKLAVPDETVKTLRGRRTPTDHLLLVRVPRALADRAASPIILPNEV